MPRTVGDIAKQGLTELPMTLADELAGLIRGSAKTTLGAPGDINELARDYVVPILPYRFRQILEGLQNAPAPFPTSEELEKKFPPVLPKGADPSRKIAARIGEGAGEWIPVDPFAVVGMAGRTAKRGLKAADTIFSNAPSAGGRKSQRGIIKAPGGNWISDHVLQTELENIKRGLRSAEHSDNPEFELKYMRNYYTPERLNALDPKERELTARLFNDLQNTVAMNKWVDSNLGNYVKKQMGTEGDPVRALAERGITHKYLGDQYNGTAEGWTARRRAELGFPEGGVGVSPEARSWEHASDVSIRPIAAKEITSKDMGQLEKDPWLTKLDPNTPVHRLGYGAMDELGFPELVGHLENELLAGRIRPEQLNKVSMPDAVQSVFAKNEAERKAKEAAEAAAIRANLSLNPYKEYPSGHKWIELPDPNESEQAMKTVQDIGCQGGWCTQQEYNAKDYGDRKMGNSLYALIDPSGKPHVQVHTVTSPQDLQRAIGNMTPEQEEQVKSALQKNHNIELDDYGIPLHDEDSPRYNAAERQEYVNLFGMPPPRVSQIKPFSNTWSSPMVADATKKNPNYRQDIEPFLQDFVKSGKWSYVNDLENAGLAHRNDMLNHFERSELQKLGIDIPEYVTLPESQEFRAKLKPRIEPPKPDLMNDLANGDWEPEFKRGGKVHSKRKHTTHHLSIRERRL